MLVVLFISVTGRTPTFFGWTPFEQQHGNLHVEMVTWSGWNGGGVGNPKRLDFSVILKQVHPKQAQQTTDVSYHRCTPCSALRRAR